MCPGVVNIQLPGILRHFTPWALFMNHKKDQLYSDPDMPLSEFVFDEQVADVFPDMISRSVPGYRTIIGQTGMLAGRYARPGTRIYDLGCSLGAATLSMRRHITHKDCKIIAIDNSEAMVKRCRAHCLRDAGRLPVEVICGDIRTAGIENASFVVLNFTLQFLNLSDRSGMVKNIFNGLAAGGAFLLSEKISFSDSGRQMLFDGLYHDFKRFNGYSEMEISRKREALENVLKRESTDTHIKRLRDSGFAIVEEWFRCYNFISILAVK